MALLKFLGAIQQVTGSCYLLESHEGAKVLLDCGMMQGRKEEQEHNRSAFTFDVSSLDAVVISHAHIDHTGLLPKLTAAGYRGPIYATPPSCELMELMLHDSAHLQEKDTEWENKWRARRARPPLKPLYTVEDAEKTIKLCHALPYSEPYEVAPGITVTFHEAGHILGSAIVEIVVREKLQSRRLVFSGDLGCTTSPLMKAPSTLKQADVVLLESTYGDRDHRNTEETLEELADILQQAHRDGGNVLIPAFAVGRTQDLIYYLGRFYREGRLPQQAVFLDSPMAIRANAIYSRYLDELGTAGDPAVESCKDIQDWLPILRCTLDTDDSMAVNRINSGAIIIAGSGMCTGGRILHHFKHNLWRENTHIIMPGFQASGTLGRALVEGTESVKLFHQRIAVRAKIHTLGGFSAHAGQSQLIDWVSHFENKPELYLIHGELEKSRALQLAIRDQLDWDAIIPEPGEQIAL
ncbi:MBL fold metallo-hydrolase [Ectopseudomonas mendocina]|uniref:MBL fold metallo-hydrolase n=1 Tax=Ectopseudomonas mendocina TaxID=300 RepID=A0ABZ2RJL9_ECTME